MKELKIISVMLDLGRQIENIQFLKEYAKFCKKYGYNTIVLYLEASVRTSVTPFFDKKRSYSLEELQNIVSYMESIGLDVIPAFENVFHLEKFFLYKELENFSEFTDEATQGRGLYSSLYVRGAAGCIANSDFLTFMDTYIKEVCSVFHSRYVHMGMDELFEFAECDNCKSVLSVDKTKKDLFYDLIMHNYELVHSFGKEMLMWDDFFEYYDVVARLPRDIILCHWDYFFIGDEPKGKWTGRIKRDWLSLYEELGFRYIFCSKATNTASAYNIERLTNYAKRYAPFGAMMTTWERADCFYYCLKPAIAYGGMLWRKQFVSEKEKIALYADFLDGDTALAKMLLSLYAPDFTFGYFDVTHVTDGPYHVIEMYKRQLCYVLSKFEKRNVCVADGANLVLADIYDNISEQYALLQIAGLGNRIFDDYERDGILSLSEYEATLDEIVGRFQNIEKNGNMLWKKDRQSIVSCLNAWERRCTGNINLVENIRRDIHSLAGKQFYVFLADLMLPDTYSIIKGELLVRYVGDNEETVVYQGTLKTSLTMFDVAGCYELRFRLDARKIEYAIFNVYGEGDIFPVRFSYWDGQKKHEVVRVETLGGLVENENNVLTNSVEFAHMGYGNGEEHLKDIQLSRIKSGLKIYFTN